MASERSLVREQWKTEHLFCIFHEMVLWGRKGTTWENPAAALDLVCSREAGEMLQTQNTVPWDSLSMAEAKQFAFYILL